MSIKLIRDDSNVITPGIPIPISDVHWGADYLETPIRWDSYDSYDEEEEDDWSDECSDENEYDIGYYARPQSNIKLFRKEEVATMNGIKLIKQEKKGLKSLMGEGIGKITSKDIKLSMSGIAIKNEEGNFVVYDKNAKTLTDVRDFVMDMEDMFYGMPVKTPAVGDLILASGEFLYVVGVSEGETKVLNPKTSTIETKVPVKNMFGYNFFVKVVNMMDMMGAGENNMLPLMLMSDGDSDMSEMMMLMMATGQNTNDFFGGAVEGINPMMLMMAKGGKGDMLETMLLMNAMKPPVAEAEAPDAPESEEEATEE